MATYARVEAVDVRVSAIAEGAGRRAPSDAELRASALDRRYGVRPRRCRWPDSDPPRIVGRTLATAERGTAGLVAAALATEPWLALAERPAGEGRGHGRHAPTPPIRERRADVGLSVLAAELGDDMRVLVAVTDGTRDVAEEHTAFLGGEMGRRRAVNLACLTLWRWLEERADR
ncbi:MAG: hypothetical protein R3C32_12040 [Chloroflexota bacterium]